VVTVRWKNLGRVREELPYHVIYLWKDPPERKGVGLMSRGSPYRIIRLKPPKIIPVSEARLGKGTESRRGWEEYDAESVGRGRKEVVHTDTVERSFQGRGRPGAARVFVSS